MINEPRVVWGEDGFASESGWAFAHCIDLATGEIICSQDVWVVVGTGLPAGAFLDQPPQAEDGKAIVRKHEEWVLIDDLRGSTAYNKQTKQPKVIDALGQLSSELTLSAPSSQFDAWDVDGECWVKDDKAEQDSLTAQATANRAALLSEAGHEIAALVDALDPEVTAEPDEGAGSRLYLWKRYRAELAVLDCTAHPVNWPQKP